MRPVREHVHGGAARQRQRRGSSEVHALGQSHQRAGGHDDLFRKTAIALHAENFAAQTNRVLAAPAEFAFAAKKIGLNGHGIADFPRRSASVPQACRRDGGAPSAPDFHDFSGDFTAGRAREWHGNRQARFFEPQIEMIQAARSHLHDDFARPGLRIRDIAQFKFSGRPVGDELDGFHSGSLTQFVTR